MSREERNVEDEEWDELMTKNSNKLMLNALRVFVNRTALDEGAPPEAVRTLPEVAKIVLDYKGLC